MIRLDKNFNFVIVGGGTAGWITALYLEKYFPETSITVVASTEIGILGAGEGTTPHFLNLLDDGLKFDNSTFENSNNFTFENNKCKNADNDDYCTGLKFTNSFFSNNYCFKF
jgi:hypothetical protein